MSGDHRRVDHICDAFEAAWQAGARPHIEQYLGDAPKARRGKLLRELLALEIEYRIRAGDQPSPGEYLPRFPGQTAVVKAVFLKTVPPAPPCRTAPSP